jgi:hypothetical protein
MQQRRYRPGDVLDDYCPRERRITDHAIVAMIDDHIKQTRCVVCDAEHEYKDGKVPPQRRKKPQAALFTQVLDGLTGPQPPARVAAHASPDVEPDDLLADEGDVPDVADLPPLAAGEVSPMVDDLPPVEMELTTTQIAEPTDAPGREEGPWRRQLIRAALPRPEGQAPPQTRPATDFTIRQPSNQRGHRHGGRRRAPGGAGQGGNGNHGPMRFGRSGQGPGQSPGQGQGHAGGRRRRGRGGKKSS